MTLPGSQVRQRLVYGEETVAMGAALAELRRPPGQFGYLYPEIKNTWPGRKSQGFPYIIRIKFPSAVHGAIQFPVYGDALRQNAPQPLFNERLAFFY
jgi:hypothetical protein